MKVLRNRSRVDNVKITGRVQAGAYRIKRRVLHVSGKQPSRRQFGGLRRQPFVLVSRKSENLLLWRAAPSARAAFTFSYMRQFISYTIQSDAAPQTDMVTVRIKCRQTKVRAHTWRLELPRLLWTSMGTEDAADFVAEQYFDTYPAELELVDQDQIAFAVATALQDAATYFDDAINE